MGEIVNLNKARKTRDRTQAKVSAANNRVVHGQTRLEREAIARERERTSRLLDGARRDPDQS
ncbi:DUF4169 family protein [Brevundimonas sp.]|uniref:DUF4169 family protein n=1 Tax=Brevundimonas sp. TaxID=1871086 RepID=UPI003BAB48DA